MLNVPSCCSSCGAPSSTGVKCRCTCRFPCWLPRLSRYSRSVGPTSWTDWPTRHSQCCSPQVLRLGGILNHPLDAADSYTQSTSGDTVRRGQSGGRTRARIGALGGNSREIASHRSPVATSFEATHGHAPTRHHPRKGDASFRRGGGAPRAAVGTARAGRARSSMTCPSADTDRRSDAGRCPWGGASRRHPATGRHSASSRLLARRRRFPARRQRSRRRCRHHSARRSGSRHLHLACAVIDGQLIRPAGPRREVHRRPGGREPCRAG